MSFCRDDAGFPKLAHKRHRVIANDFMFGRKFSDVLSLILIQKILPALIDISIRLPGTDGGFRTLRRRTQKRRRWAKTIFKKRQTNITREGSMRFGMKLEHL